MSEDEGLVAVFYSRWVDDAEASREAGRKVMRKVPHVQIFIPGNDKDIVDRKAKDEDKRRFRKQWEAYENQQEKAIDGTPLEHWPIIDTGTVMALKSIHVFTVENLAGLSDQGLEKFGAGGRELQKKAKLFLQAAKDAAPMYELERLNDDLRNSLATQADEIKELKAIIEKMTPPSEQPMQKRGPGRPRKDESVGAMPGSG